MSTKYPKIRCGLESDLDVKKLVAGDILVCSDTGKVFVLLKNGDNEDFSLDNDLIQLQTAPANADSGFWRDLKTGLEETKKIAGQKFGYAEVKEDGLRIYDKVGGKLLAGPFSTDQVSAKIRKDETPEYKKACGTSATDQNGSMFIYLPDDFKTGSDTYSVFLQPEGEGSVYISEKTDSFFKVSGTENLPFSWMAVEKQ